MRRLIHLSMASVVSLTLSLTVASTISLALIPSISHAQPIPPPPPTYYVPLSPRQLDQIVAPVALYPDRLLSYVLIASTYPQEVSDAALYVQNYPNDDFAAAGYDQGWDPNVIALMNFRDVLLMMNSNPDLVFNLGNAFLYQQSDLMNAVQRLRSTAYLRHYLRSSRYQRVVYQNNVIVIGPGYDNQIYAPYYDPTVVYGPTYWQPGYSPYGWVTPDQFGSAIATGIAFGVGVALVNSLLAPTYPDWRRGSFMQGRWAGHSDWRPGIWGVNPTRRAAAIASIPLASISQPNRFQRGGPAPSAILGRPAAPRVGTLVSPSGPAQLNRLQPGRLQPGIQPAPVQQPRVPITGITRGVTPGVARPGVPVQQPNRFGPNVGPNTRPALVIPPRTPSSTVTRPGMSAQQPNRFQRDNRPAPVVRPGGPVQPLNRFEPSTRHAPVMQPREPSSTITPGMPSQQPNRFQPYRRQAPEMQPRAPFESHAIPAQRPNRFQPADRPAPMMQPREQPQPQFQRQRQFQPQPQSQSQPQPANRFQAAPQVQQRAAPGPGFSRGAEHEQVRVPAPARSEKANRERQEHK